MAGDSRAASSEAAEAATSPFYPFQATHPSGGATHNPGALLSIHTPAMINPSVD